MLFIPCLLVMFGRNFGWKKGDLTNGNVNKSNNEREHQIAIEAQANDPNLMNDEDQVDTLCPTPDISQLMNVKKSERNKFFGSLPNHLDSDETYRENSKQKETTDISFVFLFAFFHFWSLTICFTFSK